MCLELNKEHLNTQERALADLGGQQVDADVYLPFDSLHLSLIWA